MSLPESGGLREFAQEIWTPVSGYDGLYEVSDFGRVRRCGRIAFQKNRWGSVSEVHLTEKILSPCKNLNGYSQVRLWKDGISKLYTVQSVVAKSFIGPRPSGFDVAHNNGNKDDNRLDNLRYATPRENSADKEKHGTIVFGERASWAKLTSAQVSEIRNLPRDIRLKQIAAIYGISEGQASKVRNGKQWVREHGATL